MSRTGEEFRQELRQALEDAGLAEQITLLPWVSRAIVSCSVL